MSDAQLTDLIARSAGEVERYRGWPLTLQLSLSQVMLLGGIVGIAATVGDAPAEMIAGALELAHGLVAELEAVECHGVAGVILAGLPE